MDNKKTNFIAAFLLVSIFFLAVFSLKYDSATSDEVPHIAAGYSYLTQKDFRMNPEHPPLIKDLAALPLLIFHLHFPKDYSSLTFYNLKWQFGSEFLYHSGNNPDKILFWSRIPMVLILIFLGYFLFQWLKELAGNKTALFVLTLFTFCPNFLAHGRLVTTDVGATLGVMISTYFFLKFLKNPTKKNVFLSGFTLGIAFLLKFSTILLIPFFFIITLIFLYLQSNKLLFKDYFKNLFLIIFISILLIYFVYQLHILNYTIEKQLEDAQEIFSFNGFSPLEKFCLWLMKRPIFRPLAQYLLGVLMAIERTSLPSLWPTYFLDQLSPSGFWYYFPTVYLIKIPLAFHLLTLIALFSIKIKKISKDWLLKNFEVFSMVIFLGIYWLVSLNSKLNIGFRHLLPTIPFIFILVSLGIKNWLENFPSKKIAIFSVLILLIWYIFSSLIVFPHYLSYFNELVGGSKNGYQYVVDSNLDWGQDLKRLVKWVNSQGIKKIYIDYFGGGDVKYYLGEKVIPWYGSAWWSYSSWQTLESFPKGNYFAISATFLKEGQGKPVPGFNWSGGEYNWLNDYQPIAKIGNSIFVYYIY